jgi:radical SAM-linked protein
MKVRLRFAKRGKVRFTSHRDLARMWERALRRAELAVDYTQGFSPRPKLHFGLALPTGAESEAEYIDVDLSEPADGSPLDLAPASLPTRLTPCLPDGITVQAAAIVDTGVMSLQQAVTSCTWRLVASGTTVQETAVAVERALAADELVVTRERKGKQVTDDLRPYILALAVIDETPDGVELETELGTQPRSLRPAELLRALDPPLAERRVCRIHQWMTLDGVRSEPVSLGPADASSSAHAEVRAS